MSGTQAPTRVSSIPTWPGGPGALFTSSRHEHIPDKGKRQGPRRTWHIALRTFPGRCIRCCHLYSVGENTVPRLESRPFGLQSSLCVAGCLANVWVFGHPERTEEKLWRATSNANVLGEKVFSHSFPVWFVWVDPSSRAGI